jgi:hypothetical protein
MQENVLQGERDLSAFLDPDAIPRQTVLQQIHVCTGVVKDEMEGVPDEVCRDAFHGPNPFPGQAILVASYLPDLSREAGPNRGWGVAYHELAAMNEADTSTTLRLVQVGRRHEDGDSLFGKSVKDPPEIPTRHWINPAGGFVKKQNLWGMDQSAR